MLLKPVLFLCSLGLCKAKSETVRMTQDGPVRGRVLTSLSNSSIEYYAFPSIPYAAPPLGKLRFKEPQPVKPWTNTRCVFRYKDRCTQYNPHNGTLKIIGKEDCLYLGVFVPKTVGNNMKKMPVMVWFHGGNWDAQAANITGWDYAMERPFVVVGVEYRLNVFGFFTTLDDNAKGNLGMKDQVQALEWVKNNIETFNGDPSRVTISGSGTGGASVFYHMLSPRSKGLFSGAISQSGNPLSSGSLQRNPMEKTRSLIKAFNIDSTDNLVIVKQLQKIDAETLFRTALNYSVVGYYAACEPQPFSVIIEIESGTSFLSESPYDLFRSGRYTQVPLMMGFNSQPAEFCWTFVTMGRDDINEYQNNPQMVIPEKMNIPKGSPCVNTTLRNITNRYFADGNYTNPYNWIPYNTIEEFTVGIFETLSFLSKKLPIYFYYFAYVGSRNEAVLRPRGVILYEEIRYLAYPQNYPGANPNETASDRLTRERVITMWYNFVAKRNPTPEPEGVLQNVIWPKLTSKQKYLNMNSTLSIRTGIPHQSEMPFWRQQFDACGFPDPNPNDS